MILEIPGLGKYIVLWNIRFSVLSYVFNVEPIRLGFLAHLKKLDKSHKYSL